MSYLGRGIFRSYGVFFFWQRDTFKSRRSALIVVGEWSLELGDKMKADGLVRHSQPESHERDEGTDAFLGARQPVLPGPGPVRRIVR